MLSSKKHLVLIVFLGLVGCFDDECESLSCRDLTDNDFTEMESLGITFADPFSEEVSYEVVDGQAVVKGVLFHMLPAPGTEDYVPVVASFYGEVADRSSVYFKDINGVVLDYSNFPLCFSNRDQNVSGSDSPYSVPPGMSFSLVTELDCIPASSNRIVHEYQHPDGNIQVVFDVELNELRNWTRIVAPLICENQGCEL